MSACLCDCITASTVRRCRPRALLRKRAFAFTFCLGAIGNSCIIRSLGFEIDRFANIRIRLLRSPFIGYALAVVTLALAVAITLGVSHFTRPGPAIGMLYLGAILASAWVGYGPGFFACAVTFVVLPYLFTS